MENKGKEFVSGYGNGYGYGDGNGEGNGNGNGEGNGNGNGYGYGDGYGDVYGNGYGDGYGDVYGNGYGYSDVYGYGYGNGDGYGYTYNGHMVYLIDDTPTVIYCIVKDYAKGAIVGADMQLNPCYIAKQDGLFAHGETLHEAREALNEKLFEQLPVEERVEMFRKEFSPKTEYPTHLFWEWHNKLTGSCEMGRNQFAREHGIDLNGNMTPEEFIKLTENAYGGEVIRMLKPYYCMEDKP